jgi:protein-L-isoaspartate(D-aspartate) O-methyltransferase
VEEVYSDRVIAAKKDSEGHWLSSSSQPAIMAIMLEQLDLQPGHKVLEIGAGTGYNAALMAHIVGESGQVVAVEIDEDLTEAARRHLAAAGYEQVQAVCADGGYGYPDAAPFDRIILTVAAGDITPAWWDQLKPGGRIVLPLMLKGSMKSVAFERVDDHLASLSVKDCGFIPLRGAFALALPSRVQVGPEPGLVVEVQNELSVDLEAVFEFLKGAPRDWPADLEVIFWDLVGGGLWTWLALHEPGVCHLLAVDETVEREIAPAVMVLEGEHTQAGTAVLLEKTGLAALVRAPSQAIPRVPEDQLFAPGSPALQPFALYVRQFGPDESVARRLLARVEAWKSAGRPASDRMQIRAYRKDMDYNPSESEILLERAWTKLVLNWTTSS